MNLSNATLREIKLHYTEEYQQTLRRLKELENVLKELGDVEIPISNTPFSLTNVEATPETTAVEAPKPKRAYKKRAKKRGRKSVWGDFTLKRLKAVNRPLTYHDLANHAVVTKNLDQSDFDKTRKSLLSAVFQLRKQDKVETFAKTGSRDKYIVLSKWLDESGAPLPQFKAYME